VSKKALGNLVTVALVLVPVNVSSSTPYSQRYPTSLEQHEYHHQHLFYSLTRRSSMFPLILILGPLVLAATYTPMQDLPEDAITLVVFQESTSSETYVCSGVKLMIGR